ncbi:MAG: glycosyltransferase family 39 protein [Acidobacteria bacterium]|nr:glycosyltransferase family 39 protein [Acidobacteriota bacterium]
MNAVLAILVLLVGGLVVVSSPQHGPAALVFCILLSLASGQLIQRVESHRRFLLQLFVIGLLIRMLVGTLIFVYDLQEFFGGDALAYDQQGFELLRYWQGRGAQVVDENNVVVWGMPYLIAGIYAIVGRNMLAVQFFNAVCGAGTTVVIFLCAQHIFQNQRVARYTAWLVALYPSLVLWSSQGLKDAPIVFLLALAMLATLKLGERFSAKYLVVLTGAMLAVLSLRFYIFYMIAAAIGGSFVVGMKKVTGSNLARQILILTAMGLAMTYLGVLRTAGAQLSTFGNLEAVNRSRGDLVLSAQSSFGKEVDVSTTRGALSAIPLGIVYLLFAPFPWQLANLRQSLTLPEMLVWWGCFPLLVLGLGFTLKYRLRQSLPILLFTTMLTLAYSIFQGNVGTAYRQRSQLLVFYFIFVAVGYVLLKERREERQRQVAATKKRLLEVAEADRVYKKWKRNKERELEEVAASLTKKLGF